MDIWQRGTTFTNVVNGTYTSDRFKTTTSGVNLTVTQDTTVPNITFKYSLKAVPASNATPTECAIRQVLEQQNIFLFGGKTVIASAWILCSKSSMKIRLGAQNATGGADVAQTASVTAGTWTYVTTSLSSYAGVTAWTGTTNDTGGFLDIGFVDSTALTTSDYIYITGVQLEVGTAATPFERRQYGQELALCQRYYEIFGITMTSGTTYYIPYPYKVTKRAAPTLALVAGSLSSGTISGTAYNPEGAMRQINSASTASDAQISATAEL